MVACGGDDRWQVRLVVTKRQHRRARKSFSCPSFSKLVTTMAQPNTKFVVSRIVLSFYLVILRHMPVTASHFIRNPSRIAHNHDSMLLSSKRCQSRRRGICVGSKFSLCRSAVGLVSLYGHRLLEIFLQASSWPCHQKSGSR